MINNRSIIGAPQPIAEFPDHYIRNEEIIRPKPRRLVDMRRAGIGIEQSSFLQPETPLIPSPLSSSQHGLSVRSSGKSPPILPVKPTTHLQLKPLPPRPLSTNNTFQNIKQNMATSPSISGSHAQPQQAQYHNSAAVMLNLSRQANSITPSSFSPINVSSTTPTNFNSSNQRSVPNLPQLLQKNRLFLSPQPSEFHFENNNGNRSRSPPSNYSNSPYYADLPSPNQNQSTRSRLGGGVHGDWKSVENLSQGFTTTTSSKLDSTTLGPVSPFKNEFTNQKLGSDRTPTTITTKNHNLTFDLINSSKIMKSHPDIEEIRIEPIGTFTQPLPIMSPSSPEYAQIRIPSESNQLIDKGKLSTDSDLSHDIGHSNSNSNNFNSKSLLLSNNSIQSSTKSKFTSSSVQGLPTVPNHSIGCIESIDSSSLAKSLTSDGDFTAFQILKNNGELPNNNEANFNVNNAGSTPLSRKSNKQTQELQQHSAAAPSSKLKSRRRNILQHLSVEEMTSLNTNTNRTHVLNTNVNKNVSQRSGVTLMTCNGANNTGTSGSSSSEASSGHASMSDSQTSGSPPAPADYSKLTGTPGGPISTNYKSVLKSVPEDDNGNGSNRFINEKCDSGNRSATSSQSGGGGSGKNKSSKAKHRNKESLLLGNGSSGLEDIKQAIEQLTLRSYHSGSSSGHGILSENSTTGKGNSKGDHHSSYSTSTYSSISGSECDRHRRPHHLLRHSSLETINTQITSADEFVWVDSHNRLVELQCFPWSNHDILKVIERSSRLRDHLERISMETVPRISYLLQRALVRLAREAQRLSKPYGFCTKQEISSAFRIVLAPSLADSCIKACLRAAAMFSVSINEPLHRDSKSARAGVNLHVGRFQRWMCEVRLGRYVHEFAAIHLTAGIENLIEELLGQALSFITTNSTGDGISHHVLTASLLERAISNNGDLWGLLQPFAHLNAGRTASGALALPRWASVASMDSSESSTTTIGGNQQDDSPMRLLQHNKSLEQSILTTCVGSVAELAELLTKVSQYHHKQIPISNGNKNITPTWSPSAIQTLFYFMRCSQLETADEMTSNNLASSTATLGETVDRQQQHHQDSSRTTVQELVYERPFIVLPPLIEWVRVASAHTDHRHSFLIDRDDVMQAARLLLPGIDCPVRLICSDEFSWPRRPIDEFESNRRLKVDLAFKMLTSGRSELVAQALLLMPPSKANTFNESGLSPLILSCVRGEDNMVRVLLEAGADPDAETPANSQNFPNTNNEVQHLTALTFASIIGNASIVKILLERGANTEGGAKLSEDKSTLTPLQVASATGNMEILLMLLNYGANPFLSTLVRDSLCYMGSASRGSFSAISVAAAHGQRAVLHKLLSHPINPSPSSKEVLSLEEILAEGAPVPNPQMGRQDPKLLTKSQIKVLQEAMYQSAESGHLEITLDFRNMGVPWTLHCWVNALGTAHELRCESVVDQLLQDFLQILPNEDFSQTQFVDDCLPLLFTIFRNSKTKNEATTLLLADIFQTCYGKETIKEIRDTTLSNGTRIDPKYVNNSELSDVQFRVEGKIFYSHKIVLVTSSPRFKSMLKSAPESNPPILQINDIRYHIFQMVMEYLYNGGCDSFRATDNEDILELMAAANFFQLDGLLRFCETKCSQMVNTESVVSLYIHAKVYNAVQLLEYCQGFILQNMIQILTFDDSVRRLIFGKRLHNHDVLAGLLLTLQARLKCKPNALPSSASTPSHLQSSSISHLYPSRKYK